MNTEHDDARRPPALRARGLTRRYGRRLALTDCTLDIPAGRLTGLVGPNGAGKTTLLNLAAGLLTPTAGSIEVLGGRPGSGPTQLAKVGYVAQDTPVYGALSVADHFTLGARLNRHWDAEFATDRITQCRLDPGQRAGQLFGGQRAQLALTMAIAKRPELLIRDEPVASLDPLARREFLDVLIESARLGGLTDLERACDYLMVLANSRVRIAGDVADLLATHHPSSLEDLVLSYLTEAVAA